MIKKVKCILNDGSIMTSISRTTAPDHLELDYYIGLTPFINGELKKVIKAEIVK